MSFFKGLLVFFVLFSADLGHARDIIWPQTLQNLEIKADPIKTFFHGAGADENTHLQFLGGFKLTSQKAHFGGFSGVVFEPEQNRLLLLSDTGGVFISKVVHQHGAIKSFGETQMLALKNSRGRLLSLMWHYDAESIARVGSKYWIAIETANRIYEFDIDPQGFPVQGQMLQMPQSLRKLPRNRGFEAMAAFPAHSPYAGKVLAIAERSSGKDAPTTQAWILGKGYMQPLSLLRRDGYDISDAAFLPNGDVLILERRVRWWSALTVRIRRIKSSDIQPKANLDGSDILLANLTHPIDNFEGLHVYENAQKQIILTLVSDNNYNHIQRNLLLQFLLKP